MKCGQTCLCHRVPSEIPIVPSSVFHPEELVAGSHEGRRNRAFFFYFSSSLAQEWWSGSCIKEVSDPLSINGTNGTSACSMSRGISCTSLSFRSIALDLVAADSIVLLASCNFF